LGCQELCQTGSLPFLHLKKFHPKLEFQYPSNCGGSNGDGTILFRNLEVHGEESAVLYGKIAHDLASTYSEVIYDPYPGMVAIENSWELDLIANVLPLFRHSGTFNSYPFLNRPRE
jgi:hypothetical protein